MTALRAILSVVLLACGAAAAENAEWWRMGWQHTQAMGAQWKPEPWRVRQPDTKAHCTVTHDGPMFTVDTPGTEMAWTLTLTPIWVQHFPLLRGTLEYLGTHAESEASPLLLGDGSTGPVTPGANNPENPLASGGQIRAGQSATRDVQAFELDLGPQLKTDRVVELTIFVHAGAGPASLRLKELGFFQKAEATTQPVPLEGVKAASDGMALAIPPQENLAEVLAAAFNTIPPAPPADSVLVDGKLFSLGGDAAVVTTIAGREKISLPAALYGSELRLLLGARVLGSHEAWYGGGTGTPRGALRSPLEVSVVLAYEDGSTNKTFPERVDGGIGVTSGEIHAYRVPLDPSRILREVELQDKVDYAQLMLLAASVVPPQDDPVQPGAPTTTANPGGITLPPGLHLESGRLRLNTAAGNFAFSAVGGGTIEEITRAGATKNLLSGPVPVCSVATSSKVLLDFGEGSFTIDPTGSIATGVWNSEDKGTELQLAFRPIAEGGLQILPSLKNTGDAPVSLSVIAPSLAGITVADSGAADYLLGTRSPTLATTPVQLQEHYGAGYLMQFADIFDTAGGGGLGIIVEDSELRLKQFFFEHAEDERSAFSVEYAVELEAGQTKSLPAFVLLPHAGDWHATLEQYRAWVRAAFPAAPAHALRETFYCRRDYPLGGTGYLFDVPQQRYTAARLAEESTAAFGGVDFIDISSWAYHEASGRVGDYLENELGGLEGMRACVEEAHAKGALLGLYFEGYLIDKRCPLAAKALPAWQMIQEDGKGKWWNAEMEFFCCPGVAAWRQELIGQVVEVAARTGADAVYLDQLGNTGPGKECWSAEHGHEVPSNPLLEEKRMIEETRAALRAKGLNTALYIEHVPCDGMAHLIDGAFNISINGKTAAGPTRLPLQRFVFPGIAIFEMLAHGIRPVPAGEDWMRLAFFHGMGLWLKGRGNSWYSEGCREFARAAYPIYQQYADLFRSPKCVPLIPTLQAGVYANRFGGADRQLITLYNAGNTTVDGPLLALPGDGIRVEQLLKNVQFRQQGGVLHGRLEPGAVAAVLIAP